MMKTLLFFRFLCLEVQINPLEEMEKLTLYAHFVSTDQQKTKKLKEMVARDTLTYSNDVKVYISSMGFIYIGRTRTTKSYFIYEVCND